MQVIKTPKKHRILVKCVPELGWCPWKNPVLNEIPPAELDTVLRQFFAEIRKQDGGEYEPDCLRVMLAALHRHLIEYHYPANIISDISFKGCRDVLEGKARHLREMGMGKRPNASQALSKKDEEILWTSQKLGAYCPTSLLHTMWFNNIQHLGLRGGTRTYNHDGRKLC